MTMDELMERRPWRFGLRGDTYVWAAMREELRGQPIPDNQWDARRAFEDAFRKVVGVAPQWRPGDDESLSVPKFRTGSGMSDGMVSLRYWKWTGIPILMDRAAAVADWGTATS